MTRWGSLVYNVSMENSINYLDTKKNARKARSQRLVYLDRRIPQLVEERVKILKEIERDNESIQTLEDLTVIRVELEAKIPQLEDMVRDQTGEAAQVAMNRLEDARKELEGITQQMKAAYYAH